MNKYLFLHIFLISINSQVIRSDLCTNQIAMSQPVMDFCLSHHGFFHFRCCYSSNSTDLIAIDLTHLDLTQIPNVNQYSNLTNVTVIDLRDNFRLKPSNNEDFLSMKSLNTLYLPESYPCPGDKYIWQIINHTSDPAGFLCENPKDICNISTDLCSELNSMCNSNGPNHFLCLCKPNYYGYKCLRHGQFPFGTFFGTAISITVIVSGIFYLVQRRDVKND
ncbi:unnamed protein product [Adineta ricciae]|uniref:EGF-like domain-containing protein n=1 Tax=Adineta ricciae TaxID=249248 RepID=A0A814YX99_ADIRI|nr:unnamed protein product [Adineta ricciae]CAF1235322.1 unnamed protein product [Adineta ricciae]